MSEKEPAVVVKDLYKSFKLPHEQHSGIKQFVINVLKNRNNYEIQHVIEDISFEIQKGEFFGIVGRNGSGKSTLLKLLSGIYVPDSGHVKINGSLTPFIELGVGFNPELTGRENVFLNGALLGFDRHQMDEMYDEIVHFAELEKFMDQKLKNYSSGMQVRLAFSIAIRARSDVLIMDEVLAVGDSSFQKKCFEVFKELKNQGRTIILVTHDMGNVERFCDRVLVLKDGKAVDLTTPHDAAIQYSQLSLGDKNLSSENDDAGSINAKNRWGSGGIKVKSVELHPKYAMKKGVVSGDDLTINISLERSEGYKETPVLIGTAFYNDDGVVMAGPNSKFANLSDGCTEITLTIPKFSFKAGEYDVSIVVYNQDGGGDPYDYLDKWFKFSVISDHTIHGAYDVVSGWKSN